MAQCSDEAVERGRVGGRVARAAEEDDELVGDRDVALDQLLAPGHRLVVVGGPGSGETTVLLPWP